LIQLQTIEIEIHPELQTLNLKPTSHQLWTTNPIP
jgi:hypothetical protein